MCIIIYIPKEIAAPSKEILEHCWEQNPHNAGFMYHTPEHNLKIFRSDSKDKFIQTFLRRWEMFGKQSPFVLHFRYATNGSTNLLNTHPFKINKRTAFVHNGRITSCLPTKADGDVSDTFVFGRDILRKVPEEWLFTTTMKSLLQFFLGKSNKVVLMNSQGTVRIVNEKEGEWVGGVWYSNSYYKDTRKEWKGTWVMEEYDNEAWGDGAFVDGVWVHNGNTAGETRRSVSYSTPRVPVPPKEWMERRGLSWSFCHLCGLPIDLKHSRNMAVKAPVPKGRRLHRLDVCDDCYTAFLIQHDLLDFDKVTNCFVCGTRLHEDGSLYRKDVLTICVEDDTLTYEMMDTKCLYEHFKKDTQEYSTGFGAWLINPSTMEVEDAEQIKATIATLERN